MGEITAAFFKIGLSQDSRFAKQIISAIRGPQPEKKEYDPNEQIEIKLKDFIKVFKKDEISEVMMANINKTVRENRKKTPADTTMTKKETDL